MLLIHRNYNIYYKLLISCLLFICSIEQYLSYYSMSFVSRRIVYLLIIFYVYHISDTYAQVYLIKDNKALSSICITSDASDDVRYAASELQKYINKITGISLQINGAKSIGNKIMINDCFEDAPNGSFKIHAIGDSILKIEGSGRGVVYAIYDFLEYLGCRYYDANALLIPQLSQIKVDTNYNKIWKPIFSTRDVYYASTRDSLYIDWHRQNHSTNGRRKEWGLWVHTLPGLLSADEYFKDHPEYFAMRNGKRVATQLCLSNPEVLTIVASNLKKLIDKSPSIKYWSVSQGDNLAYCECDKCSAMNTIDGSPTGSVIQFTNMVADRFPNKVISTLAYQYSQKPPVVTKPRSNVNIMLCAVDCDRSKPILSDTTTSFVRDLDGWSAICNDITIWDYVINYSCLVSPYPNLQTLQPNIKLFASKNVTDVFEQGNNERGGEFASLRSYLLCKLLIEPDCSVDSLITDFCNGYYGNAGIYIKKYINLICENLEISQMRLGMYDFPNDWSQVAHWLSPPNLEIYQNIFDDAEECVKNDSEKLYRVQIARQPLFFAQLEQAQRFPFSPTGLFSKVNNEVVTNTKFTDILNLFIERCKKEGVTKLSETNTTPDEYLKIMTSISQLHNEGVISYKCPYTLSVPPYKNHTFGSEVSLTDGRFSTLDYTKQWVGWNNDSVDIVIDLGSIRKITSVSGHFLQNLGATIFYPVCLELFTSNDNNHFILVKKLDFSIDPSIQLESKILSLDLNSPVEARFVKLRMHSIGVAPSWHKNAGVQSFIFVDEVLVK